MPRAVKPKKLARIAATREGSIYGLRFEDEAGKKVLFELTSDQALQLADGLDNLLADEEQEPRPTIPDPEPPSSQSASAACYQVSPLQNSAVRWLVLRSTSSAMTRYFSQEFAR
jgi:hypothetical protein